MTQTALPAALGASDALISPPTGMRPYSDADHTDLVRCLDTLLDRLTATASDET